MTVFFTADTHFGHGGARGLYRRPFDSVAAMDAAMLSNWNAVVGPDDEVWHLGDFAVGLKPDQVAGLLDRLAGIKHLVTGNNDTDAVRTLPHWRSVQDYAEMSLDGVSLVLCHYAFRSWRNMHRGSINLHGHSHGRLKPALRQHDVGVDCRDFRPVRLTDLSSAARRATAPLARPDRSADRAS